MKKFSCLGLSVGIVFSALGVGITTTFVSSLDYFCEIIESLGLLEHDFLHAFPVEETVVSVY